MHWIKTHHADPRGARLADRHYSRKKPGSRQFMPPGRKLVLITENADAVWGSSWPFAEYVFRAFPAAWCCTLFRNESPVLSSVLIREAVAATRAYWGEPPPDGMITLIDPRKVRSSNPGYCYLQAGFRKATPRYTKGGQLILQLLPQDIPTAEPAIGSQPLISSDMIPVMSSFRCGPGSDDALGAPLVPAIGRGAT